MAKSILQNDKECYLCRRFYNLRTTRGLEEHHILFGRGRRELSERYTASRSGCATTITMSRPWACISTRRPGGCWNRRHNLLLMISTAPAVLPRCLGKKFSF